MQVDAINKKRDELNALRDDIEAQQHSVAEMGYGFTTQRI